jgi:hypothetical protein
MRFCLALLTLAAATAGCGGGGKHAGTDEATLSYQERLKLTEGLAVEYPGDVSPGDALGEFGLWAGIIVQTRWQEESGRDELPLWNLINVALSVEPSRYAAELTDEPSDADPTALCSASAYGRDHPTRASDGPDVDRSDVCEAWMRYFAAHLEGATTADLQELLWNAHTAAIVHGVREHRAEIEAAAVPDLERNFWASWFELVFLLDAVDFSTAGAASVPASAVLMPRCAPLGDPGCELTREDLGDAVGFVSALATRPASIDRIFDLYELGQANPAALLVPRDLSLARGLTEYLAAARGS